MSPESPKNATPLAPGAGLDAAPETNGAGDEDEGAQAQSVADGAVDRASNVLGLNDSEKVKSSDPGGDGDADVQDLVDHMRQMDTSGHIDMSAFAGERNDDEEEGRYGEAAEEE